MGREDWGQVGWVGVVGWVVTSPQVTLPPLGSGWMGGNVTSGNVTSSSASAAALSAAASAVGFPNHLFFFDSRGVFPAPANRQSPTPTQRRRIGQQFLNEI